MEEAEDLVCEAATKRAAADERRTRDSRHGKQLGTEARRQRVEIDERHRAAIQAATEHDPETERNRNSARMSASRAATSMDYVWPYTAVYELYGLYMDCIWLHMCSVCLHLDCIRPGGSGGVSPPA